jgi:hypothetical protein
MKKLLFLLLFISTFSYGQKVEYTDVPFEMYGVWRSIENEFLKIYSDLDGKTVFQRVKDRTVLATGEIKRVGNELHILRSDNTEEYNLIFVLGESNMVITKPRSDAAWLWDKIQ